MILYEKMLELDVDGIIKNLEVFKDLGNIKCVVPISGGKDSQTCLKMALEKFNKDEVLGLFCDTQYEHPYTYEHVEVMKDLYGVAIVHVNDGGYMNVLKSMEDSLQTLHVFVQIN